MRIGFSSIKVEDIAEGIAIVGGVVDEMLSRETRKRVGE